MIAVDATSFPILLTRWLGQPTLADIEAFFGTLQPLLARAVKEKTYVVILSPAGADLTPQGRCHFAALLGSLHESERSRLLGTIMLVRHTETRGATIALSWMWPQDTAIHMAGTPEDALATARSLLFQHDMGLNPVVADRFRFACAVAEAASVSA